jgi:hypothetical protein
MAGEVKRYFKDIKDAEKELVNKTQAQGKSIPCSFILITRCV